MCHRAGGYATELPDLCEHEAPGFAVGSSGSVGAGVFVDDYSGLDAGRDTTEGTAEADRFDQLVEWVRQRGRVREDAARLVVLTRTAGVSVDELAAAEEMDPQTLRQRRLCAERRVRQSLTVAR